MKILVTGGAGFIGSHLVDALLAAKHDVLIVDDLSTGLIDYVPAAAGFVPANILDPNLYWQLDEFRPEAVFHFAAQSSVAVSVENPAYDAEVNVVGTVALIDWCRRHDIRRFFFASTGGAMYGDTAMIPTSEAVPPAPSSPYGCSKRAAEMYLARIYDGGGFRSTRLRFANVYGPRQRADGESGVVAILLHQALHGAPPTIHGDGNQTRDFIYVDDVVRACLVALERDIFGTFNIGTGRQTSVNHLYSYVRASAPKAPEPIYLSDHSSGQRYSALDSLAFQSASGLSWQPKVSLIDGVGRTAAWLKDRAAPA